MCTFYCIYKELGFDISLSARYISESHKKGLLATVASNFNGSN